MGIVKQDVSDLANCSAVQVGVLTILDEYDYSIADLRYIEEYDQLIITMKGVVLFVSLDEVSISFEINSTPDFVANLILILSERIPPKLIHITDSFIITRNPKGEQIAVFGEDAQEIYERDLAHETYHNKYFDILMSPNVKFFKC